MGEYLWKKERERARKKYIKSSKLASLFRVNNYIEIEKRRHPSFVSLLLLIHTFKTYDCSIETNTRLH